MKIQTIPIDAILLNDWNPNRMGKKEVKALGESYDEFGEILPTIVRQIENKYQIIDGEHRYWLARDRELSSVTCVVVEASDSQSKRLTQILNRTRGQDDPEKLKNLIEGLLLEPEKIIKGWAIDTPEELESLLQSLEEPTDGEGIRDWSIGEDEMPKENENQVKRGEIWQLGRHQIMCGDATSIDDVKKLISDRQVDMIFTDPPYGINESGDRRDRGGENYPGQQYVDFIDDSIEYAVEAYKIAESLNVLIQVWWGANYYCHHLPQTGNWIVWDKRCDNENFDWNSDGELAWVKSSTNSVRIFRHLWQGFVKDSEVGQKRVHPTQKPVALAEWCCDRYGKDAHTILDFFLGSGSTLIACEKMGKVCLGMELSEHYCSVIVRRWEKFTGQQAVKIIQI